MTSKKKYITLLFFSLIAWGIIYAATVDIRGPSIGKVTPFSEALLPVGDFDIEIEYDDSGSDVDGTTDSLTLQLWTAGVWWGADIAPTYVDFGSKIVTSSGATYPVSSLPSGKYRATLDIDDNTGNTTSYKWEFYRDAVEFIISSPDSNIGNLYGGILWTTSTPLQVTVKTIGAGFTVTMTKTGNLEEINTNTIDNWDGVKWYGRSQSWSVISLWSPIVVATQSGSINTDGILQTYTYNINFSALVDIEQVSGDYEWPVSFAVQFDFAGQALCILDGITEFWCKI